MTVTGPDFIALQVRDPEHSAQFYETVLGLRRAPKAPSGAVVFAGSPVPFAVREPLPGVDLDEGRPRPRSRAVDALRRREGAPRQARRGRHPDPERAHGGALRPGTHLRRPRRLCGDRARPGLSGTTPEPRRRGRPRRLRRSRPEARRTGRRTGRGIRPRGARAAGTTRGAGTGAAPRALMPIRPARGETAREPPATAGEYPCEAGRDGR